MKLYLILMVFILVPGAFGISSDMKEVYQPGETMIAQIYGEILEPILPEDVKFLRDSHIEVPFDYDLKKINGAYYIYAIMPLIQLEENESKEYSMLIEDVSTTVNGQQQEVDFEQIFKVSGAFADYTVNPGIIVSSDDFEIEITLNKDVSEVIQVDFPIDREIILRPGKNSIRFDVKDISGGLYEANIGTYKVPVYINKEIKDIPPLIAFDPFEIDSRIVTGVEAKYSFSIKNNGEERIEEFSVVYNKDIISISPDFPDYFEPGKLYEFEAVLIEESKEVEEFVIIQYGNESYQLPIRVEYIEEEEQIIIPNESGVIEVGYYCSELNGKKCSSSEICSGESVISRDVKECCLSACTASKEGTELAWVGWALGVTLVLILGFVGWKYYKTNKKKDTFQNKIGKAEKKILPFF